MISLVRGPGGVLRRGLAEVVPLGCACVAAGLYMPLGWTLPVGFAAAAGALTFVLTWVAVSALLRVVRARPGLCRVYRVAVLLHVGFWSALGIAATANEPAGALRDGGTSGWKEPVAFRAGVASVDFALPAHATLAGWGQKPRRLTMPPFAGLGPLGRAGQAVMGAPRDGGGATAPLFRTPDPAVPAQRLGARALVLRPDDPAAGAPVAIVRMDLVTADRALNAAVAESVADLGFRREGVLLAATHTHSGPGGYSRVPLSAVIGTDHFDPAVFDAVRDACVAAVRRAHDAARPARLELLRARDRAADGPGPALSRNRRKADPRDIDDRVYGLLIHERDGVACTALVLNYAVHPVLLRRRHMGFHRDLAGALEDAIRAALPRAPLVLFLNGAQGDVSAQRVPDAHGAARATALARRFARDVVVPAYRGHALGHKALRVATARTSRRLATPRLVKGWGGREKALEQLYAPVWSGGPGTLAANAVALPLNAFVWSLGLPDVRFGFSWEGALGVSANLEHGVGIEPHDVGAWIFETGPEPGRAAARFALLWQPGEATQAVGKRWRQAAADLGIADTLLVGIAGGSVAYVTTEDEYHAGGYEAVGTLFGPQTAAHVEEMLLDALVRAGAAR